MLKVSLIVQGYIGDTTECGNGYVCKYKVGNNIGIEGCDTIRVKYFIPIHVTLLISAINLDTRTTLKVTSENQCFKAAR